MKGNSNWIVGILGALFGAAVAFSLTKSICEKQWQANRTQQKVAEIALNLQRDIRLLEAIKKGNTNSANFLLEMELDSDIIALYTMREQIGLSPTGHSALSAGLLHRMANPFVRTNNGVDRGDLVEGTIKSILRGERVSK
jgi:hypothetical protein